MPLKWGYFPPMRHATVTQLSKYYLSSYITNRKFFNFDKFPKNFGLFVMFFFRKFIPRIPVVKAQEEEEEELVDPQQVLRDKCNESDHCQHLKEKYDACNDRVNSRSKTTEICSEELFDWLHAVDHCVTKDLFSKLK